MKLGEMTQMVIGSSNIKESLMFYEDLGFDIVQDDLNGPLPWAQISDWSIVIMLSEDYEHYFALTYFAPDMDKTVFELEAKGIKFLDKRYIDNKFSQGIIMSPDDFAISIINYEFNDMFQAQGNRLIDILPGDVSLLEKYPNVRCGVFGEISIPVKSLKKSVNFWRKLGFELVLIKNETYPWVIMTDEINIIGLHQTSWFEVPAISYFAPDMQEKIKKIKQMDIDVIDFAGKGYNCKNGLVKTPDDQIMFFLTAESSIK